MSKLSGVTLFTFSLSLLKRTNILEGISTGLFTLCAICHGESMKAAVAPVVAALCLILQSQIPGKAQAC